MSGDGPRVSSWRESLRRRTGNDGGGEAGQELAAATARHADVSSMLEAWIEAPGVSDRERVQRKLAARVIDRALLHKFRFASGEEEMAWLKEKAEEAGCVDDFMQWLEANTVDTPMKVWEADIGKNPEWPLNALQRAVSLFLHKVGPHIRLEGFALLRSLPDGLRVNDRLVLRICTGLTSLPGGLHVGGYLKLEMCNGLTSLPDGLHVNGSLELNNCDRLTSLPQDLYVGGPLVVYGCTSLTLLPDGLHVDAILFKGCTGLTSLPDGLRVGGYMHLIDCTGLTSLPDSLHAGGDLGLGDCTSLTSLPDGLHVGGNLNLYGCTGLTSLPDDLRAAGGLSLQGFSSVTSLPDGLYAAGDLGLDGFHSLASLPDGLHVSGQLSLKDCRALTSLPTGLHVDGGLVLQGCNGLMALPDSLRVVAYLTLANCTGFTSLPDGLRINDDMRLWGCTGITSLPDGLCVDGHLDLEGCADLTSLPDDLHVGGYLSLMSCTGLASLPNGLHVDGVLALEGCAGLMSLADDLHVGGDLLANGCTGLMSLPVGLHVGGQLYLADCTGLTSMMDDLHVGDNLDLTGCTGLTSLHDVVLEWDMCSNGEPHNIYLAGSGLPPEELARLQTLNNPALRFYVSMDETETFGGAGLAAEDFLTLDDAAAFWAKEAVREGDALAIEPFVDAAYVRGVLGFLSKLRRAKEFNNSLAKKGLAKRVVQVLELVTGEDNTTREELQVRMADAIDTCSDKPMWALNQMQVLVHIAEARGDREALRALGMGVMRLEVVHRHVRKAMDAMNFVDDVCVYLRFEIALRESLELPVSALEMLYPSYVAVAGESIAAAEADALLLTEADLEKWLPDWSEWQRQDRVECADSLDFQSLKRNSTKRLSLSLRSLLGGKIADPVRLKPLATVWSLHDLLKHWVNTGMDLNNTPRDVDYMCLNLTKCT